MKTAFLHSKSRPNEQLSEQTSTVQRQPFLHWSTQYEHMPKAAKDIRFAVCACCHCVRRTQVRQHRVARDCHSRIERAVRDCCQVPDEGNAGGEMSKLPDLTISDVANEIRTRREHVVNLIKSGALRGYDVTPPGAKRKSYRIPRESLDQFKAGRSAQQTKTARRRTLPKPDSSYVEYFS